MKKLILIAASLLAIGCVGLETKQDQAATVAPPPQNQKPANTKQIDIPAWPIVTYIAEDMKSFVILGVKDPKSFPVPAEMNFKNEDGSIVVKMTVPKTDK